MPRRSLAFMSRTVAVVARAGAAAIGDPAVPNDLHAAFNRFTEGSCLAA